jgi:hypothetical protein
VVELQNARHVPGTLLTEDIVVRPDFGDASHRVSLIDVYTALYTFATNETAVCGLTDVTAGVVLRFVQSNQAATASQRYCSLMIMLMMLRERLWGCWGESRVGSKWEGVGKLGEKSGRESSYGQKR